MGGSLSSPDGPPDSLLAEPFSLMALIREQISTGLLSVLTSPLLLLFLSFLLPFFLPHQPSVLPHPFIILSFSLSLLS